MFSRGKALCEEARISTTVLIFQDEPNYPSIIRKVSEAPDLGSAEVEKFYCSLANPAMVKEMSRVADRSNNHISMKLHRLSWNAIEIEGQPRTSPQDVPSSSWCQTRRARPGFFLRDGRSLAERAFRMVCHLSALPVKCTGMED